MRILKSKRDINAFVKLLKERASGGSPDIEQKVREILDDVRNNGDKAVLKYTKAFDSLATNSLRITPVEISRHAKKAKKDVVQALKISARRIRNFHERQKEKSWSFSEKGNLLGQVIRPLARVGVYVPGGKASYPSTVLMNVIPAQVADVKEIALCVPTPKGEINPYVMAAIDLLGIQEVYRVGGSQAIGAMAYGTASIKKVDKIVGPGNIYVATAKKMVFGEVDIDMIAGPSEILIIAEDLANPAFIAADLLSQAEHDELASSILITNSGKLADRVSKELDRQLSQLTRKEIARKSVDNYGAIIITRDLKDAVVVSNRIAPEHLEIMTAKPIQFLPMIENAGAIFLGEWTPEALGDYAAGPNHTLPTGGTAKFSSPLGVYDFIKRSSLLSFTKEGFEKLAKTVKTIAVAEGLEAHGKTITVREVSPSFNPATPPFIKGRIRRG
ncbi:MAG: histidinol dehydrogenase [Nitrospirae bacterium RBG_13_43_8]|nr:MAG: histidinol dehydrogenase [Nitrospirae bacterium RBG_13_43_8]